jgi:hypothetical protein
LLAKEKSYKVFYKTFFAKGLFEKYISKNILEGLSLILQRDYLKPKFYLLYANKSPWPIHMVFIENCFIYKNLFITVLFDCFEFLKLCKVGLDQFGSNLKSV